MNIYVRRNIKEPILCACGCGKVINKYDKRGRERKFHGDCFRPGIKLSVGAKRYVSKQAQKPWRIIQSIEKISKIHQEIKEGKRNPVIL